LLREVAQGMGTRHPEEIARRDRKKRYEEDIPEVWAE
jgi:hypothetical protein